MFIKSMFVFLERIIGLEKNKFKKKYKKNGAD